MLHLTLQGLRKGADTPSSRAKGLENGPHVLARFLQMPGAPRHQASPATNEGLSLDCSGHMVELIENGRWVGRPAQDTNEADALRADVGARVLLSGRARLPLFGNVRGSRNRLVWSATCIELAATLRRDERITLTIDTATGALRKYSSVTLITPTPMPEALLAGLSPATREAAAKRSLEPFEVEQTVDFDPKFDERIDQAAFTVDPSNPAPPVAPLGK